MPTFVRTGMPSCARPLFVPPRCQDGGEVARLLCIVRLSQMKGSWPAPALALGLVFLDQLGLGRSGSCRLMYRGPLVLLTDRCLETSWDYNPTLLEKNKS